MWRCLPSRSDLRKPLREVYEDNEPFPLFQNRLVSGRRGDYRQFVERMALDPANADPMEVLALIEVKRQTDHLEVFPMLAPSRDGSFTSRFFLHGSRHANAHAQARRATGPAVQIETAYDYLMLGWAPRYLVGGLPCAMAETPKAVTARVVRLNADPAPPNHRLLVELSGQFALDHRPMSGKDFQPLVPADPAFHRRHPRQSDPGLVGPWLVRDSRFSASSRQVLRGVPASPLAPWSNAALHETPL